LGALVICSPTIAGLSNERDGELVSSRRRMAVRRKVFLSYRRSDSEPEAGRVAERLSTIFGDDAVFFDTASIGIGEIFPDRIADELAQARVLLVVIGKGWLPAADQYGRRRIDDPKDWVRIELENALTAKGLEVVPILLDGIKMPPAQALPAEIAGLVERNALPVSSSSFGSDMRRLVDWLESRQLLPVPHDAPTLDGPGERPSSMRWHEIGFRYDEEQRATYRMWAAIAIVLAATAVTGLVVILIASGPGAAALPFPALLVVFALTSVPKSLNARANLVRSGNLLMALDAAPDLGDYKRLEARAMEMYA
jgi:hypothetical protein